MSKKFKKLIKSGGIIAAASFILGALVALGIRFATYHNAKGVHYHANFGLYINGQREQLKDAFYYEEESSSCDAQEKMTPHERAHMHDNVNSIIHIHDNAVTWGNFFQNIGWVVDNNLVETPQGKMYLADSSNKVSYILNGKATDNVINQVIGDQDRLLVNFGNVSSANLQNEYKSVPATAHKYDISKDPASCGGGVVPTTMGDRFKHMF
jgi:hypothetical protein